MVDPNRRGRVNLPGVLAAAGQALAVVVAGSAASAYGAATGLLAMGLCALGGSVLTLYAFDRAARALDDARALLFSERQRALAKAASAAEANRHERAARDALIIRLAKIGARHDTDADGHHDRLSAYSVALARELRGWFPEIDDAWIERLGTACVLHDIGQAGVDHAILLKPSRLTPAERRQMQRHPLIGADTLLEIRRQFGDDPLVSMGIQVALSHHERWDGQGYPYGLVADQIAPAARIVALADVYDALTSARVYREALPHAEAVDLVKAGAGTQFDPAVVDAFVRIQDKFEQIRRAHAPAADEAGDDAERMSARDDEAIRLAA